MKAMMTILAILLVQSPAFASSRRCHLVQGFDSGVDSTATKKEIKVCMHDIRFLRSDLSIQCWPDKDNTSVAFDNNDSGWTQYKVARVQVRKMVGGIIVRTESYRGLMSLTLIIQPGQDSTITHGVVSIVDSPNTSETHDVMCDLEGGLARRSDFKKMDDQD